jgi:DNA ligase-1
MEALAQACERISATTKKSLKLVILADYFNSRERGDASISAVFLSGRPFPAFEERTLQVGGSLLWKIAGDLTGSSESDLRNAYRRHGDLGSAASELWTRKDDTVLSSRVTLADVRRAFEEIASYRGTKGKESILKALLARATALEAKYILKVITGDLRIGLKESLVEEAIAKAYCEPVALVQRANMLVGDIGETLLLAAEHRLGDARMRLFHPIGFMLASPATDATEAFEYFQHARVEDKYDGIRAQAHSAQGEGARFFSRTLDDVTGSFPELVAPLCELPGDMILDGEIVAWKYEELGGHAMPFTEIQKRLGRKQVDRKVMEDAPVAYIVFDVLYGEGDLLLERPLAERVATLDRLFPASGMIAPKPIPTDQARLLFEPDTDTHASGWILRAPAREVDSPEQLETLFDEAMARGNEGLMIKDVESPYLPGRRGRWWLKLKRELATLDVVVTVAEYGHGKRIHALSDYTFAVRKGEELVNIGKAYSGLTDAEIDEMTEWLLAHTTADHGFWREVEPKIVLEVAFNAIMRSDRHNSGYALRFPRIVRIRQDKLPSDINTVEDVEAVYLRQHGRGASS